MIGNDWDNELNVIWNSPNFNKFYNNILNLYEKEEIYPPKDYIFNALKLGCTLGHRPCFHSSQHTC